MSTAGIQVSRSPKRLLIRGLQKDENGDLSIMKHLKPYISPPTVVSAASFYVPGISTWSWGFVKSNFNDWESSLKHGYENIIMKKLQFWQPDSDPGPRWHCGPICESHIFSWIWCIDQVELDQAHLKPVSTGCLHYNYDQDNTLSVFTSVASTCNNIGMFQRVSSHKIFVLSVMCLIILSYLSKFSKGNIARHVCTLLPILSHLQTPFNFLSSNNTFYMLPCLT